MKTKQISGIIKSVWRNVIAATVTVLCASGAVAGNWNDSANRETAWPNNGNVNNNDYTISTPQELAQFAWTVAQGNNYLDKTVTLTADIDLGGHLWTPAGRIFCGTFDGDGRAISSMTIDLMNTFSGEMNAGLFAVIEKGAVIKNVRFTDVNIWCVKNGPNVVRAGAVAGVAWKALIENCVVDGTIGVKNAYEGWHAIAGGIVGDHMQGGIIRNCINRATIWVEAVGNGFALGGGIAGVLMESRIENSLNTGKVWGIAADTLEVGGLVGRVDTQGGITVETWIENCLNTGNVECSTQGAPVKNLLVGALVGKCNHSTIAVANSYWTTEAAPLGGAATASTVIKATGTPGTLETTHPTLGVDDLEFALTYWAALQNAVTPDALVGWSAANGGYPAPVQGTVASVTFSVALDHNDGKNTIQEIFATYGQAMPEAEMPILKDHTFLGFFDGLGQWAIPYYTENMLSARPWDKSSGATLYAQWKKTPKVEMPVPEVGDKALTDVSITAIDVTLEVPVPVTLTWKRVDNAEAYFMYGKRTLEDALWDGVFVKNPQVVPDNKLMADFVMDDGTQDEYHFFTMRALKGPPPPSVPGPDGIDGTDDDLTIESATPKDKDPDTGIVTVPEGGSEITVGGEPIIIDGVTDEDGKFPPGTVVFPDGTIIVPGPDADGTPAINPDGTVNVGEGDIIILPPYDKPITVPAPGGTYDPSYPGIVISEDPKVVILIPDGTVIVDNGDGTTSIVLPGPDGEYFTGDDLTVSPASPADVDKETGYVTVPEGGSEITFGGEPIIIDGVTDEDGKFPPGTVVFPDGTIIVPGEGNTETPKINEDGTVTVGEGDIIILPPYDNPFIVPAPGGTYDPSIPGIIVSEDPKVVILIPDGTVIVDNGDGTTSIVLPGPDGEYFTGDDLTVSPASPADVDKGTGIVTVPEGGSEITFGGEPIIIDGVTDEDGKFPPGTVVFPDGTIIVPGPDADGTPAINPDGTVTVGEGDKIIYPPYDEVYIVGEPGGIYDPSYPGIVISEDPKVVILIPDGTVIVDNGDGTTSIVLPGPDGEYFTEDDLTVSPASPADVDKETGYVTVPEGGSEITFGGEPIIIDGITDEDGKFPPGTVVFPDGTIIVPGPDADGTPAINPDGTVTVGEGDIIILPPYDNPFIVPAPGGTYDPSYPGIVISEDPKVVILIPDGTVIVDNGDGTVSVIVPGPDGEYLTGDDVTIESATPEDVDKGTGYVTVPEGGSVISTNGAPIVIDGVTDEDGKFPPGTVVTPDGFIIVPGPDADGTPAINEDGTVTVGKGDIILYPPYEEPFVVPHPGGTYNPDGSNGPEFILKEPVIAIPFPVEYIVVSFETSSHEAENPPDKRCVKGLPYGTLPKFPDCCEDIFIGWFTASKSGDLVSPGTIVTANGNHTLWAHWDEADARNVGATFTVDGYEWMVLRNDGNGNVLITTTAQVGTTAYHRKDSSSYLPYPNSLLDQAMRNFYTQKLNVLKNYAQPAVFPVERAHTDYRTQSSGWSYVVANGAKTCFALSTTEVYNSPGFAKFDKDRPNAVANDPARLVTNGTATGWWTRSPQQNSKEAVYYIRNTGAQAGQAAGDTNFDDNQRGIRPALWISTALFNTTLTFDANGGTTPDPLTKPVTFGMPYGKQSCTERAGYEFEGWYTAPNGGVKVCSTDIVATLFPHTVWAQWTAVPVAGDFLEGADLGTTETGITSQIQLPEATAGGAAVTYAVTGGTLPDGLTLDAQTGTLTGSISAHAAGEYTFAITASADNDATPVTASFTLIVTALQLTVTFDVNGGSAVDPDTQGVTWGLAYGPLPETAKGGGFEFGGWYLDDTLVTQDTDVAPTVNHTLVAKWIPTPITFKDAFVGIISQSGGSGAFTYYIPLATAGGAGITYETVPTGPAFNSDATAIAAFGTDDNGLPRIHHDDRTGIRPNNGFLRVNVKAIADNGAEPVTALIEYYVVVDNDRNVPVFLTFDPNGGTVFPTTKETCAGRQYRTLPVPVLAWHEFLGWYTQQDGGTEVTELDFVPVGDHTLWARWELTGASGPFFDGGDLGTHRRGDVLNLNIPEALADGVTFTYAEVSGTLPLGLTLDADGTLHGTLHGTAALGLATLTVRATPGNGAPHIDRQFTITVDYQQVAVTFNANGGGTPDPCGKVVNVGEAYGTLATVPPPGGYMFKGWFTEQTDGTEVTSDTTVTQATDHTLWAQWRPPTPAETAIGGTLTIDGIEWVKVRESGKYGQGGDEFALLMLNDVIPGGTYQYADSGFNGEYGTSWIVTDVDKWYDGLNAPTLKAMAWSCLIGASPEKSWPSTLQDGGNCIAFIPRLNDITNLTNAQRAIGKPYWTSTKAKLDNVTVGFQRHIATDGVYYDVSSVVGMRATESMSTYARPVIWVKQK